MEVAARALDERRAGELSAARRAPALTELHRSDLVAAPQLERRRRGMQKTQKWHSQVWCECHFCVGFFTAAAAQPAEWPQRHGACRLPRKACQMRWSCARVGVEVSKATGMMPEHSPVPPEACRGPRVDDQRRTVPMLGRGPFRLGRFGSLHTWLLHDSSLFRKRSPVTQGGLSHCSHGQGRWKRHSTG